MSPTAPSWIFLTVSTYSLSACRCAPETTVSFNSLAFSAAAMNRRTPTGSVAIGFSVKTCLRAFTAASKCCGRYPGGVQSITMSRSDATIFLNASKLLNRCSASTFTRDATDFASSSAFVPVNSAACFTLLVRYLGSRSRASDPSSLSSNTSPIATSSTLGSPLSMFTTACVPRPPQPTMPAFNFSAPAPRTSSGRTIVNAAALPASRPRRVIVFFIGIKTSLRGVYRNVARGVSARDAFVRRRSTAYRQLGRRATGGPATRASRNASSV